MVLRAYRADIDSKAVIEMMMLTQYFDMLKDVGTHGGNSSVFIPHRHVSPPPGGPAPLLKHCSFEVLLLSRTWKRRLIPGSPL